MMGILHVTVVFVVLGVIVGADPNAQYLVTDLPGQPSVDFAQYAGYVEIDATLGKNIFYWFAEAEVPDAPLLVWYQGGPGCSLGIAMLGENGPFQPDMETLSGNLVRSPFGWNRLFHTLYVDSPVGAGYSYSETEVVMNDTQTARDSYNFLQRWLAQYPTYASSPLWLAGESWAGVSIPLLTTLIMEGSDASLRDNLQGVLIGNPSILCPEWQATRRDYIINNMFYHALIPMTARDRWFHSSCPGTTDSPTRECDALYEGIRLLAAAWDPDDLYYNKCTGNATLDFLERPPDGSCVPISDRRSTYLNRADVQAALHARPTQWVSCAGADDGLLYNTSDPNMVPFYTPLFDAAKRVLIFSGDVDVGTCPFVYSQLCLADMKLTSERPWRPWLMDAARTAGYVQEYDKLTFATLKGAGHEAPLFTPASAFEMIRRYVFEGRL
mmetsp:Transcript_27823/g.77830  ORF Transcript_27823/g.77830 Transcript_27823/m.77830 type:complete len:440 (+) Transcript_27823:44-1363(+)